MADKMSDDAADFTPPEFAGKVVVFYIGSMASGTWGESGVVLDYVSIRTIAGRRFIVGRLPEAVGDQWLWGLHGGIAWESVAHYLAFNSVEDYKSRVPKPALSLWKRIVGSLG